MFRKETVLEGYYASVWETGYLVRDREPYKDFELQTVMDTWFREHLQFLLEQRPDTGLVFFEDLPPKQVYQKMLENPHTKFRFKILVEVGELARAKFSNEGLKNDKKVRESCV